MHKLHQLSIEWNYDNDAMLSIAKSPNDVLQKYFSMKDWDFIRHCFLDMYEETQTEYEEKCIIFNDDTVHILVENRETQMPKIEYFKALSSLYDCMIIGANDDHHSVRYETWWQEFTEIFYQLNRKIEIQEQLMKGSV